MNAIVLLGLVLLAGWVLGVAAFVRIGGLKRDIAILRRQLEKGPANPWAAPPAQAAAPDPVAPARVAPAPVAPAPVAPVAVVPAPAPAAAAPAAPPRPAATPPPRRDLEAVLTQRWGTWLGAVALLLAGVFLIRYAVEHAVLGPAGRCAAAGLLGAALLACAEGLRRRPGTGPAPSALAAGGAAVLFGAAYGAASFYALVPPLVGFALLAAAAALGLAASLRFGPLAAAVGVAGAFATPALVATAAPWLPGLFAYLLAVTAAALAVMRYTAWTWLGWAATAAGAAWVLVAGLAPGAHDVWAVALFVPIAVTLHVVVLPREALDDPLGLPLGWAPFAVLGFAGLVVATSPGDAFARGCVLALVPLAVWRGWTERRLDWLPWLAALFFFVVLLAWPLPGWLPAGMPGRIGAAIRPVLPGHWPSDVIVPLLATAATVAGFLAAVGLWAEARAPRPLVWATLPAVVPLLTLVITYAQVTRFERDGTWAFAAAALAGTAAVAAARARRDGSLHRAGVHAASAAAALALGCAILLADQWLTMALALFLPPLAWIEARADLPALRRVALAVAVVVLARLLLNVWVLDYAFGTWPAANGLLVAYGVPGAAFALAARWFLRRGDDQTVAVLEGGAIAFAVALVALEIRHGLGDGSLRHGFGLREATLQVGALAVEATLLDRLTRRKVGTIAARLLGGAALAGGAMLLAANPAFLPVRAGWLELAAGYALPGLLAAWAARTGPQRSGRLLLGAHAAVAGFVLLGLVIRLACHPDRMALAAAPVGDGEMWAYSGAWLAYGGALMAWGIGRAERMLRLAGLAIIGLATAKVFVFDMAGLAGLWRVLSFLGLGLALIAVGAVYRRFVIAPDRSPE